MINILFRPAFVSTCCFVNQGRTVYRVLCGMGAAAEGGGGVFKFVLFYCLFFDMVLYVMAVEYGIRYYSACRSIGLI